MIRRWDKSRPPRGPYVLNRDCPQAQGLVAWYPLGGPSGAAYAADQVGKTHLGSGTKPKIVLGPSGEPLLEFASASSQYLNTASIPVSDFPLSVSSWFNPFDTATTIIVGAANTGTANDYWGMVGVGGKLRAQISDSAGNSYIFETTATATVGAMNHGVNTYTGGTSIQVYLNGASGAYAGGGGAGSFPSASNNFGFASWQRSGSGLYFNGRIGETAIWNVIISADIRARLRDPGTKFELWYPLRSRKWFTQGGGASLDLAGSQTASLTGTVTATGDLQYAINLAGTQTAGLSGALAVSGDIEITPAPTLDLAGSQTASLSGVFAATGDLQYTLPIDLSQTAAAALTGSLSVTGDLEYSTAVFLDIAAQPIALTGTFAASGDLDPYPSLDLAGSQTASLSGSVTVTGDIQSVVPFDVAFSAATALAGVVSITGDLEYSTTPITTGGRVIRRGRTKFPQPIPETAEPEEVVAKAPSATLVPQDAMRLLVQDAREETGRAIKKARVASAKRRMKIEQEDERAIERALLEWF